MTRRGFLAIAAAGRRDETLARMAERELAPHEFVLLRTSDGATVARRWSAPAAPAPLGSLVKPFLALAYGETHEQQYPELTCEGCWLPRGHGRIPIGDALAYSCNSYFKQLVERMDREAVRRTALRYGLDAPADASADVLIGRYGVWRAAPETIAAAYMELTARRAEPGVPMVLGAMRRCARLGTAAAVNARVAAKTGTAPCVHNGAPGDGLLTALFPLEHFDYVLLVRAHAMPGAECARRASPFLRQAAL
ncbi:MAG: hypothetical protein JSU00_07110 [Acidobacteria bacterium]|nr:hypothetical protein [Acidobacteriota bacterium]